MMLIFPKLEKVSWLLGSGMDLVLNIIFRNGMKSMVTTLPGPVGTLSLGVESQHDLQLEEVTVSLAHFRYFS